MLSMKYITKEILKTEPLNHNSNASPYIQAFSAIEKSHDFITTKLGENWEYLEFSRTETENIPCPNKCHNRFAYIDMEYSNKSTRNRVLSAKCPCCNSVFYAYQEISHI